MHECYDTLRSIAARARDEESAGTRGAARGQALAQWVLTWRAHPIDQRMAVDARNSTRQRLLFFVAKYETLVAVHRLHHRGLRIPSSSHVVVPCLSGRRQHRFIGRHRFTWATKSVSSGRGQGVGTGISEMLRTFVRQQCVLPRGEHRGREPDRTQHL